MATKKGVVKKGVKYNQEIAVMVKRVSQVMEIHGNLVLDPMEKAKQIYTLSKLLPLLYNYTS